MPLGQLKFAWFEASARRGHVRA